MGDPGSNNVGSRGPKGPKGPTGGSIPGPQGPVGPNGSTPSPYRINRADANFILQMLGIYIEGKDLHIRKIRGGHYLTGRIIK